ncbi:MOSC domain-containing protein [Aquimarina sp. AU119]|uniref:MOSC domain-containing protein n=1 Tax=Aquimarina sp. AU119 TaxID=2108528 RepID=UPI000D685D74|nr:MOSC N-terminal beta barrel domain-containing protein [Aquimarina sp. AU119]
MKNPYVSKIRIYPIKSLDPIEVSEAEIGIRSLKYDRAYAMVAEDGRYVNGKRTGRVNELKATYDLQKGIVQLSHREGGDISEFELREGNTDLDAYLSNFFDLKVILIHRTEGELMDIPSASSVTIVSKKSLVSIHKDLNSYSLENIRLRFRANIEIEGVAEFWEEKLFKTPGIGMRFKIGDVEMIGVSPRARCNVPPQDPFTGESDRSFARKMMKSRAKSLPENSDLAHYGSMYHLTVNTYLPDTEKGKKIILRDTIEILEPVNLRYNDSQTH